MPYPKYNPSPAKPLDVLFIDDSTNLCRAMELWLTTSGYSAEIAVNAHDAEEIAKRRHPRVVIADLSLPDASGYDLRLRLIQIESMSDAHYIALSGRSEASEPRKALQSGFDNFMTKPPDFKELSELLNKFLSPPQSKAGPGRQPAP